MSWRRDRPRLGEEFSRSKAGSRARGLQVRCVARNWGRVDDLAAMVVNPVGHQARGTQYSVDAVRTLRLRALFRQLTFPDDHRQGVVQCVGQQASFA